MSRDEEPHACRHAAVVDTVRALVEETDVDLTVSDLVRLALALDVPAADLIEAGRGG